MSALDHARELIALREKATQGGWYCVKNDAYHTSWLLRDKDRNTLAQFANWQNKSFEIKAEHNADFCLHATNHAAEIAAALIEAEERIAKLEARLEIDHVYDGHTGERKEVPSDKRDRHFDGIECRDETIRGLKSVIEELTTERDALQARIDAGVVVYGESEHSPVWWCHKTTETHTARIIDRQLIAQDERKGDRRKEQTRCNSEFQYMRNGKWEGMSRNRLGKNNRRRTPGTLADREAGK
jgi:hypothetical protein